MELSENWEKTLTGCGRILYIIRQLQGRRRVCRVVGLERKVRIRQCSGGVCPRLVLDSPSVIARLAPASRSNLGADV